MAMWTEQNRKHIIETQIAEGKQIHLKVKKTNNPHPSAAGFTHSGDKAPLVNEINNRDKNKKRNQNENNRNRAHIRPKPDQMNGSRRHPSFIKTKPQLRQLRGVRHRPVKSAPQRKKKIDCHK
jgi:hypothetical protein